MRVRLPKSDAEKPRLFRRFQISQLLNRERRNSTIKIGFIRHITDFAFWHIRKIRRNLYAIGQHGFISGMRIVVNHFRNAP